MRGQLLFHLGMGESFDSDIYGAVGLKFNVIRAFFPPRFCCWLLASFFGVLVCDMYNLYIVAIIFLCLGCVLALNLEVKG